MGVFDKEDVAATDDAALSSARQAGAGTPDALTQKNGAAQNLRRATKEAARNAQLWGGKRVAANPAALSTLDGCGFSRGKPRPRI